jgi:exopolyphosphatase/guanosine-5'-triphosphate,3'-diphosphate pyrophosphatase
MPKRIAIVDIGSNSARVVIYQRTSRFGFHLIKEQKAAIRISEGSFENGGYLQESAIKRAVDALQTFKEIIKDYKARKTLIIATAAVRNAPNRYQFLKIIRERVGLNIKVIDGDKEAYYGAVAAKNLLPIKERTISVDIGGGSTDIALIQNNSVIDTISLDIGTIKIKELITDKNLPITKATKIINQELSKIPAAFKDTDSVVAIGGVLRTIAKSIMQESGYTFKKIHAFRYNFSEYQKHIESILNAKNYKELENLYIKESRFDTIKEGLIIFKELLTYLNIDRVTTSGVGVREGLFLHDMLRGSGGKFPKELNPSIVSINDRFDMLKIKNSTKVKIAKELFNVVSEVANLDKKYLKHLIDATKISHIGKTLTIYNEHKHAYYIAAQELNWQYTHKEMLLIATIMRSKGDKLIYKPLKKEHKKLLPSKKTLKWLGFIYTVADILHGYSSTNSYKFSCKDGVLQIESNNKIPLFFEDIKDLKLPKEFKIELKISS